MTTRAISTYSMWSLFWNCRKAPKWSLLLPFLLLGKGAAV